LSLSSKIPNYSLPDHITLAGDNAINHNNKDRQHNQTNTKINLITKGQKPYTNRNLNDILNNSTENSENVCGFIIAGQNEIDIKESLQ
jgi:hypothetical protein